MLMIEKYVVIWNMFRAMLKFLISEMLRRTLFSNRLRTMMYIEKLDLNFNS